MTKEEIIEFIEFNKKTEFEEIISIKKDCYILFIKLLIHFGFTNKSYKIPLELLRNYLGYIDIENKIYDYILIKLDNIDLEETSYLLEDIDDIHEKAYNSLDSNLQDIEVALDMDDISRVRRNNMNSISENYNLCYKKMDTIKG